MEKKYQIFISSTYRDLKSARLKVRDAILSMYHFPVGMEMFGALKEKRCQALLNFLCRRIGQGVSTPGDGVDKERRKK